VLAAAWASGLVALACELISSRRRVPAVFALAPGVAVYLFASALGTASWRMLGLGAMAGSACWYLVAVVPVHDTERDVLVASLDAGPEAGRDAVSRHSGAVIFPMAVLAALAAAVLGLNLPGARSSALVAWRSGGAAGTTATTIGEGAGSSKPVQLSTLVQVGQEEVDNPSLVLFTVHSAMPTRELIATLDEFNGSSWSASPSGPSSAPGPLLASLGADERQPPAVVPDGAGHAVLVQVFEVSGLGGEVAGPRGYDIPTWGYPSAMAGAGQVTRNGPGGSIVSDSPLQYGTVYGVSSVVADPSSTQLNLAATKASEPLYLQLPGPVPARIARLAARVVADASTPYEKALDIEAYLTSSSFHYQLPARTRSSGALPSAAYAELSSFLFASRTGYCQQFATAFAVLARIEGLPTRIAVGFLPGTPVGHDEWQVDGDDTHAWPQVLFKDYGWIDFEPTPGTPGGRSPAPGRAGSTTTTLATVTPTTSGGPAGGGTRPKAPGHSRRHRSGVASAAFLLVLPLAMIAWAGGVPLWRRARSRRVAGHPRAEVLAAWGETSRALELAGMQRRRAETYIEFARRSAASGLLSGAGALALYDLASLMTTACYGADPLGHDGAGRAREDARTVVRAVRGRLAHWQRLAAALDPRGLRV
jgi:transglutaminase-like putative cysteine protease